ncbi:sigma-70 family RNA polymerase sigma factor [Promicromonospora sp. NPDC050249]|uniref:sigma-70 family RNA polymerase sigma factor n=1 Tax=Promicromonospora sp. NPDC050249 TaxID=3154743 RepID=UPI0033F46F27
MTATGDLRVDWVVHRPNVVRSVAARVPGIDAEEAASRALEKMVRIVSTGTTIEDPAPYWRRAAVNEAISMTREAGRAHPVEDDTLDRLTPPIAGAELDAERHADVTMLRTALSDLADDDRQLLLERHVHDRAVADIATHLGVRPHAVTMRLRRAEERLAGAFAAAHAQGVNEPECRTTRAAMHDYLKGRLLPRRQQRLEVHMDGCPECTRAFVDVREVSWMLRDLGQHLVAGGWATGAVGTGAIGVGAIGTGAVGTGGTAGASGAQPRSFGRKETAVAAGVLAVLAVGAGAAALIANQGDEPPVQAVEEAGPPSLPGPPEPPAQERPPTIPPADPAPRPATTPKEDAVPAPDPERKAAEPEPADVPPSAPDIEPAVDRPAPRAPADKPAAPAPAPEPKPEPEPKPPRPTPPPAVDPGGPPGNPSNPNGRGPAKYNDQGPGNGNGRGNGQGKGQGQGNGRGNGHDDERGNGQGHGNRGGIGKGNGRSSDHGKRDTSGFTVPGLPATLLGGMG